MGKALRALRSGRGLPTFAAGVLGWMVLVILWGAVVRATGSGAGCGAHWPQCNGTWVPQHPRLATLIEFTHRSMSGICTALVASLVTWTFAAHPKGSCVRKVAVISGVLLLTEAFLGAVLVLGGYVEHNTSTMRVVMQCVHFTNTLLLLGALSLTWWWQKPRAALSTQTWSSGPLREVPMRSVAAMAVACTVLTGATGSVAALADTLFPSTNLVNALQADFAAGSPLLVRMRWMHPAASLGSLLLIAALAFGCAPRRRWTLLAPVWLQVAHLFGADLLWIALIATTADVFASPEYHPVRQPGAPTASSSLVVTDLTAAH